MINGFQRFPKDTTSQCAETNNYFSVTNAGAEDKVEAIVKKKFLTGNYVVTSQKPAIITTFGAVTKSDSDDLQRIHDCSLSKWLGVNSYISIDKQKLETIVSVIKLISKDRYMAKIYICYAYRSVPVCTPNHHALGIKWHFSGDTGFTYLVDTCLPTGRKSVLGIFLLYYSGCQRHDDSSWLLSSCGIP